MVEVAPNLKPTYQKASLTPSARLSFAVVPTKSPATEPGPIA